MCLRMLYTIEANDAQHIKQTMHYGELP